jgi:hypothetical protein
LIDQLSYYQLLKEDAVLWSWSVGQSVSQIVAGRQAGRQSVSQSVSQSISQSVNQSISESVCNLPKEEHIVRCCNTDCGKVFRVRKLGTEGRFIVCKS